MQQKLADKEDSYRKELLRLQTNSDRDMLELRRKLDKMDLSYQEQLEKKQEQHEKELGDQVKNYIFVHTPRVYIHIYVGNTYLSILSYIYYMQIAIECRKSTRRIRKTYTTE